MFVDREDLEEQRLTVHLLACGICGDIFNTRDEAKSCFFSHLVYITDGEGELDGHRLTVHLLTCGICGEMSNTRDEVKSCFFSHLVYITDGEGES